MDRQTRLLLILVGVLVALVALDRWWEPEDPLGNPDATALVWSFEEPAVQRVEAVRDDGLSVILQRDGDDWMVEAPFEGRANQRVASRLVRVLAEIEYGEPITVDDPASFGLADPPRATVRVTDDAGVVHEMAMGRAAPSGWRTYVRGADGVVVIDGELENSVFFEGSELRDRHILRYDPAAVRSVMLQSIDGTLVIRGEGSEWWVDGYSRADLDAVEGLVAGLLDLQLETFLDETFPDGIPEPERIVTIELADGTSIVMDVGQMTPLGRVLQIRGGVTGAIDPAAIALLGQGPTDVADVVAVPIRQVKPTAISVSLGDAAWSVSLGANGWSRTGEEDLLAFEAVETLRNVGAHHELTPAPTLTEDWGRVVLTTPEGAERVIRIGQLDGGYRVVQDEDGGAPYRASIEGLAAAATVFN